MKNNILGYGFKALFQSVECFAISYIFEESELYNLSDSTRQYDLVIHYFFNGKIKKWVYCLHSDKEHIHCGLLIKEFNPSISYINLETSN